MISLDTLFFLSLIYTSGDTGLSDVDGLSGVLIEMAGDTSVVESFCAGFRRVLKKVGCNAILPTSNRPRGRESISGWMLY